MNLNSCIASHILFFHLYITYMLCYLHVIYISYILYILYTYVTYMAVYNLYVFKPKFESDELSGWKKSPFEIS